MTRREGGTDERLRVLQVGCGGISQLWLDALRDSPQATVVGFVDLDADRAAATGRRYGGTAPAGDDLRAMLAATRPDVVFDCTVPEAHRDVTIAALEAGCHVFGEKPMADSWDAALEMVAAARNHGRTFAVTCTSWNPEGSWYAHGASAIATFEMTGGVIVSYRGSWCAEGLPTAWESHWRLIGTRGTVVWDGAEGLRCEVVGGGEGLLRHHDAVPTPVLRRSDMASWHAAAIESFLHAVRTGSTPETDGADNLRSFEMVFAACESADSRRPVALGQARDLAATAAKAPR